MALSTAAALARFGLGAREGSLAVVGRDARGFLAAELDAPASDPAPDLPGSAEAFVAHASYSQAMRAAQAGPSVGMGQMTAGQPSVPASLLQAEVSARIAHLTGPALPAGFVERLVWFWANHFCVSAAKSGQLVVLAGPFEREAIRPHVLGRFADMLVAVATHPAMLLYLDNAVSIGPNSPSGLNRRRGLNENLAREILELHTLGVGGGYTQADVTSLSRMITGWTVAADARLERRGVFAFNTGWHEPGPQTLLGRTYPEGGREQGVAALRDLAAHPATARHVAVKLARHFVSDAPPAALVARLTRTFADTDGDLRAMARVLLDAPEAWAEPATKLRSPREFLVAAMRLPGGFSADTRPNAFMAYLQALGEPIWTPPAPNGFPDAVEAWTSPEGLTARLNVAVKLASKVRADYRATAGIAFGVDGLSDEAQRVLAGAESRQQAAAILLMAPEFQRR